jgi:hypothetical protein
VRFVFEQNIHRTADDALCVKAIITGTGMNNRGRPSVPRDLTEKLLG